MEEWKMNSKKIMHSYTNKRKKREKSESREGYQKKEKQIKTHRVKRPKWDLIKGQIYNFVYQFTRPWEGKYAVLLSKTGSDVRFEKLPNTSQEYWINDLPWHHLETIGTIEGRGLDGIIIDVQYENNEIHEEGYYNISINKHRYIDDEESD
ncbi:MAG: hypothetical protein ACP5RX_03130 [Minisyncoccia bacterium]